MKSENWKYLYRIRQMEIKSWLKYLMIQGKHVVDYVLGELTTGTNITIDNTVEKTFYKFDIKGNSTQDGTPTPETEVPLLSAGDDNSISEKISNKNWLPTDVSDWEQGTITNGTNSNSTTRIRTKEYYSIKYDNSYYVSIEDTNYCFLNIFFYDSNKNYIDAYYSIDININGTRGLQINVPNNSNIYYMRVTIRNTNNSATITPNEITDIKPMIVEGTTATTYVAHQEQTYTIPVQQPMRSIGTVRDEFIKVNGEWKERHNLASKFANENNNWAVHPNGTNSFELNNFIEVNFVTNVIQIISNYFKGIKFDDRVISGNNTIYPISNTNFVIRNTSFASLEDFKTWLSTHNLEVIYQLATPVDLPCTAEQIAILENLPTSYNEQTNIYSLDVTPAYIEAQAYVKKEGE